MKLILQFVRFGMVGGTCFAIDYGIMILLTEVVGWPYLYSAACSFVIATVINYFLSSRFVFDHKKKGRYDLIIFVILGIIGLGLNQLLLYGITEHVGIDYRISKIGVSILVSFYNFVTRKLFLERNARKNDHEDNIR